MLGTIGFAVGGSYSKISNNCILLQLVVGKDLFEVVVDGVGLHIVEQPHHFLGEPDIFIGINGLDTVLPTGRHKRQIFRRRRANQGDQMKAE